MPGTPINVAYPAADELHLRITLGNCRLEAEPGKAESWVAGTCLYPTSKRAPIIHTEERSVTITEEELSFGHGTTPIFGGIPRYELELGKDKERPFTLTIDTGASELDLDLGGVPLKALLVRQGAGRFNLNFSVPNPVLMSLLEVSSGVAGIQLVNLANANFSRMLLSGGAAGYDLNFDGSLSRNATVDIESGLSGVEITVPRSTAAKINAVAALGNVEMGDGFAKREGAFVTEAGLIGLGPHLTIRARVRQGTVQLRAT
jgi:hypothetical protein